MFKRSWVQIPEPYTGLTFSHILVAKIVYCLFEKTKINEKETGDDQF